jgi:hypothetical protein
MDRLRQCRAHLMQALGTTGWGESQRRGEVMSTPQAIDYALASFDALAGLGD